MVTSHLLLFFDQLLPLYDVFCYIYQNHWCIRFLLYVLPIILVAFVEFSDLNSLRKEDYGVEIREEGRSSVRTFLARNQFDII